MSNRHKLILIPALIIFAAGSIFFLPALIYMTFAQKMIMHIVCGGIFITYSMISFVGDRERKAHKKITTLLRHGFRRNALWLVLLVIGVQSVCAGILKATEHLHKSDAISFFWAEMLYFAAGSTFFMCLILWLILLCKKPKTTDNGQQTIDNKIP